MLTKSKGTHKGRAYYRMDCDFADCADLHDEIMAKGYGSSYDDGGWGGGGFPVARVVRGEARPGTVDAIRKAFAMVDKIDVPVPGEHTELMPYGSSPSVGAHLSGHPCSMWHRVEEISTATPVRVFFGVGIGGRFTDEQAVGRAAVMAALVLMLAKERPVELFAYEPSSCGRREGVIVIRVGTGPFDIGRLSAVSETGFARRFCYRAHNLHCRNHEGVGWPRTPEAVLIGASDKDIVIPCAHNSEHVEMKRDPEGWVRKMVLKARAGAGDAWASLGDRAEPTRTR